MNGDPATPRRYKVLFWLCGIVVFALLALAVATFFGVRGQNSTLDAQTLTQERQDCARRVSDTTTRFRDAAEEADREANRAFGALIVYAIRNPSPPGTVRPEVQVLNDLYDRALQKAAETGAALDARLAVPNAERVERQCPSV